MPEETRDYVKQFSFIDAGYRISGTCHRRTKYSVMPRNYTLGLEQNYTNKTFKILLSAVERLLNFGGEANFQNKKTSP